MSRPRNFLNPQFTPYGIQFADDQGLEPKFKEHYIQNAEILRGKLGSLLKSYENVYTHNPWGEYGHEEHVQVYRVLYELQKDLGYNIWCSNYCSTRTVHLTSMLVNACESFSFASDKEMALEILNVYEQTHTWTWYDHWSWPSEETFFRMNRSEGLGMIPGKLLQVSNGCHATFASSARFIKFQNKAFKTISWRVKNLQGENPKFYPF